MLSRLRCTGIWAGAGIGTVRFDGWGLVGLALPELSCGTGEPERAAPELEARVLEGVVLGQVAVAVGWEEELDCAGRRPARMASTFLSSITTTGISPGWSWAQDRSKRLIFSGPSPGHSIRCVPIAG